jgi:hypothetical protein
MFNFGMKPTPQGFGANTWDEVGILAGTIMGEAGGESDRGKAMVADTLWNRAQSPHWTRDAGFGPTPWDQALAQKGGYYQYNAWMPSEGGAYKTATNVRKLFNDPTFQADPWRAILGRSDARQLSDTLYAIRGVMGTGELRGVAGGAEYYANPVNVASGQKQTHWNMGMNAPNVLKEGNHEFYGQGNGTTKYVPTNSTGLRALFDAGWHSTTNPYTDSLGLTKTGLVRGGNDTPVEMRNSGTRFIESMEQPSLYGNSNRYLDFFLSDLTDQWNKGGNAGTGYRYDPSTQRYYLNTPLNSTESNDYGYGGYRGYDPSAYGYNGTNYSTGDPQNATSAVQGAQYMWLGSPQRSDEYFGREGYGTPIVDQSGQPDITVYANPQQWWDDGTGTLGVANGGYGNQGSAGGIQVGNIGGLVGADTGGTVGASDGGFTYNIGNQYFDQGQQAAQQQFNYQQAVNQQTQQQIDQNISGLNPQNNPYAIWV